LSAIAHPLAREKFVGICPATRIPATGSRVHRENFRVTMLADDACRRWIRRLSLQFDTPPYGNNANDKKEFTRKLSRQLGN
jgi:hypothetical protein